MLNPVLQDAVFKQLRDFIYEKSGIFIPDTKKYLIEKKLAQRLVERNLSGFEDYLPFLRYSANGDELAKLFDCVTTNETYFFREPAQFTVLLDVILPRILEQKRENGVRIWSAASSTGDEAYTIAILLMEKKPGLRCEITGSDISNAVLETAKRGVYGSYSVRNVPEPYLSRYFKKDGWSYELSAVVKNTVKFQNVNLTDDRKVRGLQGMDVIFCRNVLIYFDEKAKRRVVSSLYDCLRPGGFLLIGSSESLHNITRAFRPVVVDKVIAYQRA